MCRNQMKNKTIMIVETELHFHNFYAEMLKDSGFEVINAYDGYEAVTLIEEKKPDLIIANISLNMMTGDTLFLYIKNMPGYKDMPFIMVGDLSQRLYKNLEELDPNLVFIKKKHLTEERLLEEIVKKMSCSCN